jgi:hypothetical protein
MLGSLLIKIGGILLAPFGAVHDALKGDAPALSSSWIAGSAEGSTDDANHDIWSNTIKYYIGGTFVVTALLFSVFGLGKLFKKKRTYTRRKKATKRKVARRRTYKKRRK